MDMANELTWMNDVNVDEDLSMEQQMLYREYREANRKAQAARVAFEESMQGLATRGKKLVFNYRFGKLSLAIADGEYNAKPTAKPSNKPSLSDFLAEQENGGYRR